MEDKIKNFKNLKIWQKSMELAKVVYQATDAFSVLLSEELGFLKKAEGIDINASINEPNKMITGLVKCL